jgi:hypothetical protein
VLQVHVGCEQIRSSRGGSREGSPDHIPALGRGSRQCAVESYIFGVQPRVQTGHHQGGGKLSRCKDPGSGVEVVEGGWVPRSVGSWKEGLREGRRRKKVTRWVGTKRGSVVGTR